MQKFIQVKPRTCSSYVLGSSFMSLDKLPIQMFAFKENMSTGQATQNKEHDIQQQAPIIFTADITVLLYEHPL